MAHKLPRGVLCPLITPLKGGDALDMSALDRLIDHVGQGADALLLADPIWGEGLALTPDTRLALFYSVLEIVQGRWPVIMTITCQSGEETRNLVANMEAFLDRLEYAGIVCWFDYPLYYHSNRSLPAWYMSLAGDSERPILLGNNAGVVGKKKGTVHHRNIRTSVLKKLMQIDRIEGLVFNGSLKRSLNYNKATRHRQGFAMYDGDERVFISRPSTAGVMAGGANLVPAAWRDVVRSCLRGDFHSGDPQHANRLMITAAMLEDLIALYRHNPAGIMKRMLHVVGVLPHAGTSSAWRAPTERQNRSVETLLARYGMV
jgi:4-hydroxy-tetrahydrodipicolinate synthase